MYMLSIKYMESSISCEYNLKQIILSENVDLK
jgi:hypothetical protein